MFQKCEIAYSRVSLISVLVSKETSQELQMLSRSLSDCQVTNPQCHDTSVSICQQFSIEQLLRSNQSEQQGKKI